MGKHIKIMIDNATAVSVINNKGTSHNDQCNDVACDIWNLCEENSVWLTAAYIPGKDNVIAHETKTSTLSGCLINGFLKSSFTFTLFSLGQNLTIVITPVSKKSIHKLYIFLKLQVFNYKVEIFFFHPGKFDT